MSQKYFDFLTSKRLFSIRILEIPILEITISFKNTGVGAYYIMEIPYLPDEIIQYVLKIRSRISLSIRSAKFKNLHDELMHGFTPGYDFNTDTDHEYESRAVFDQTNQKFYWLIKYYRGGYLYRKKVLIR